MGTSLDCLGSYNDGFTLSLIWRVMEEALGLGPKGKSGSKKEDKPRVPQSELPRAGKVGTAPPGGDRTRASIRAAKEEHERSAAALKARGETEAAGACCTCVCPPEQGFGQAFDLPPDIAARYPSVKQNDPCPAAVTALFPDAVGLCKMMASGLHSSQDASDMFADRPVSWVCAAVPAHERWAAGLRL